MGMVSKVYVSSKLSSDNVKNIFVTQKLEILYDIVFKLSYSILGFLTAKINALIKDFVTKSLGLGEKHLKSN